MGGPEHSKQGKLGDYPREMASALMFETPGTCFATKEKWKCAPIKIRKNKHSSDVLAACPCTPEFTRETTASLSQQQRINHATSPMGTLDSWC